MGAFQHDIIAQAIDFLAAEAGAYPDLDALAARFGYESTHFQKLFKDQTGISPKRMTQYMQYSRARDFLLEGYPTLDAAHAAGVSGNARLHDLFVTCEAASPGTVAKRGDGMTIQYGFHASPVGEMLIAQTEIGVCWLGFVVDENREATMAGLRGHWPKARLTEDQEAIAPSAAHILRIWRGDGDARRRLTLDLHGTNFQIQVWRALLKIPAGGAVSYHHVASALGDPNASRAVGTAVGANPVCLLIPCHRVIQKSGIVENYRWGTPRKKILLGLEADRAREGAETARSGPNLDMGLYVG